MSQPPGRDASLYGAAEYRRPWKLSTFAVGPGLLIAGLRRLWPGRRGNGT